ncbi:MAG: rod shape-determining protein RodA [Chlamydiae bacterium]|nr:rod shape-determining protein RodA [Chlamydiota bacterium]MBI3276697.1 rod shape-determining protein RodA [Chlamydiota bacterium]
MIPLRALKFINLKILFLMLFLLGIGLAFIYSASYQDSGALLFVHKQLFFIGVGLIAFWFAMNMEFRTLNLASPFFYFSSLLMLVLVLWVGQIHNGAKSWFDFGFFSLQPSEIAKMGIVFMLARYLSERREDRFKLSYVLISTIWVGIPMLLILKQPDLGTAMVLVPVLLGMLFIAGARLRYLVGMILLSVLSLPVIWSVLHSYQRQRLMVFLNPNRDPLGSGYHAIQSKIAVGSGGWFGKGWLQGTQSQLHFVPERHTDFIFSVLGEEWGFIGCWMVLLAYLLLILSALQVATSSEDLFGRLLAVGFVLVLIAHVIINTGMTVGVAPITGIPLSLISYGGSHLITIMACLGFIENIHIAKNLR